MEPQKQTTNRHAPVASKIKMGEGGMKRLSFNDEMMKAWLDGRKTVTRRLMKFKEADPDCCWCHGKGFEYIDCGNELSGYDYRSPCSCCWPKPPCRTGETVLIGKSKAIIKSVRPERIQEITTSECVKEGLIWKDVMQTLNDAGNDEIKERFAQLWDSLYPGSWDRNDWCWVIELERVG